MAGDNNLKIQPIAESNKRIDSSSTGASNMDVKFTKNNPQSSSKIPRLVKGNFGIDNATCSFFLYFSQFLINYLILLCLKNI